MYNLFFKLRLKAFSLNTCFLLLGFSFFANAQEQNDIDLSKLVHIGMEQGLSSNKVNCMFQDKKGFMWFGTDYGLNRYDGYNFKVFKKDKTDSLSLTSNDIKCLAQDAKGNIWIGTAKGLNVMNYETGKISQFTYRNQSDSFQGDNITALLADDNSIWIAATGESLIRYKIFTKQLETYKKVSNNSDSLTNRYAIDQLVIENNGNILAGGSKGLLEINTKKGIIARISLERRLLKQKDNYSEYRSSDWINIIYKDANGNIYIGTEGASTMQSNKDSIKNIYLENIFEGKSFFRNASGKDFKEIKTVANKFSEGGLQNVITFVECKPGKILFFKFRNGGFINKENNDLQLFNESPLNYPKEIKIKKTFKDKSGKLWFITSRGLETLEPLFLQARIFNLNSLEGTSIVEDKDSLIWLGTNTDSILSINVSTEKLNSYKLNKTDYVEFVTGISQDNETIYGINGSSPFKFDKKTNFSKNITDSKNLLGRMNRPGWNELYYTSNGSLFVYVDEKGIAKLDPLTGKMSYVVPNDTIRGGRNSNNKPYCDDGKDNLYIVSTKQIIQLNYFSNSYKVFDIETSDLGDYENKVTSITIDSSGNIWIAISDNGLAVFNLKTQKIYKFTLEDGLPSNKNSRVLFVNGAIWVNYSGGIYKFIPPKNMDDKNQKPIVKAYGVKDGLPNIDLTANDMIRCGDGKILFTADTLLISFYPDSTGLNKYTPPVVITSLTVNNKNVEANDSTKILSKNISSTDTIQINYKQNSFSIEYAGLSYIHSEDNNYAYKMDGIDTSWVYCGNRRFITYSNLRPGTYILHVKASNNDGFWSDEETKLTIIISPAWWKTTQAYLFYVVVFLGCIFGFIHYRTLILSKQKNLLEKNVAQRTNELYESLNNLKSTQTQLIQSEKMASLGELTAGIAHEIQNPLNFVNNFSEVNTELIKELVEEVDKGNTAEIKTIANDIQKNEEKINHHGKRADAIVKGMLRHSKSSSGIKEPTNINALCDEYLRLSYHGLRAKDKSFNVTIKTDFDNSIGKINIIPQEIGRVMLNLLTNAFYAVNEKRKAPHPPKGENKNTLQNYEPTVTVKTSLIPPSGGGGALITVEDNGNGIPQKVLDKIFQPFFTTKPTGQGTGLGLSMSYDIITKGHGGELKVQTKEGEGAEFIIILPT